MAFENIASNSAASQVSNPSTADNEFKSAWNTGPSGPGVGQFTSSAAPKPATPAAATAPAASALGDLSALSQPATSAAPAPAAAPAAAPAPAAAGSASADVAADPVTAAVDAVTSDTPVSATAATQEPSATVATPTQDPRLDIDASMSADEQYRRAWLNEHNGYYDNPTFDKAPAVAEAPAAAEAPKFMQQDDMLSGATFSGQQLADGSLVGKGGYGAWRYGMPVPAAGSPEYQDFNAYFANGGSDPNNKYGRMSNGINPNANAVSNLYTSVDSGGGGN